MNRFDILASVKKKGSSFAEVADDCDVSRTSVTLVAKGEMTSKHIAARISEITGLSLEELFPGKYNKNEEAS